MPRYNSHFPSISRPASKGKWSSHPPPEESYEIQDLEKRRDVERGSDDEEDEEEDSDYTDPSSPTTSDAYEPMLGESHSVPAYAYKINRRRCNIYFALVLGSMVIVFILFLTHSTRVSRQEVASGIHTPPPPPPLYESFPFLKRYHGGIRTLVSRAENVPEYPTDKEDSLEMLESVASEADEPTRLLRRIENYTLPAMKPFNPFSTDLESSPIEECFLDAESKIRVPRLHTYDGRVQGFPDAVMGSYDIFGLNGDVCFDRYGRLGPYGYGYSRTVGGTGAGMDGGDTENAEQVWGEVPQVDFRNVNWADAQTRCLEANKHRFVSQPNSEGDSDNTKSSSSTPLSRQAVVIRTWTGYEYDEEDLLYFRAMINELSLTSGAEYDIHFLVHVKNTSLPIWSDHAIYQQVLNESLPEELRGMGTLWSEQQMEMIYAGLEETHFRDLGVYGVYRSTNMPVQYFAHQHPEYDYFWHWEVDIRYTGHFYHLFDRVGKWAKEQPRKGLWERNARFYVPSEHGSWEDFRQMVRVQTEHGTNSASNLYNKLGRPAANDATAVSKVERPIWGPEPPKYERLNLDKDPRPPTTYEKDKYEWGVGEDADLITFNPLFDPDQTGWILSDDVTGYNRKNGQLPPRRTAIVTASRLSRKLLETMHYENAVLKHSMFSEMWSGSCALHHGLKAVYAPHPVFIDRKWPTDYLAATFNGGRNGASGGSRTSTFNDVNQRNFLGVTWYYHAGFAPHLFKRWMGFNVDGDGGLEHELANEGRMCLPGMLLHPVKQVDLVYEDLASEEPIVDDEGEVVKVTPETFGPGD